jgi:peptidoglycan/xylan/chitin deacetylase (PgdA/CDA1 family)
MIARTLVGLMAISSALALAAVSATGARAPSEQAPQEALVRLAAPVAATVEPAPTGRAALAATSSTTREVFYRARDASVAHRTWTDSAWSSVDSLGGRIIGPPAAAMAGDTLWVFGRGLDHALWAGSLSGDAWGGWQRVGGALTSGPAATGWTDGQVTVVVRGVDDTVSRVTWNGSGWSEWQELGGRTIGEPAVVATGATSALVAVTGTDTQVWTGVLDGGAWSGWTRVGGRTWNGPALARTPDTGTLEMAVRGTDDAVWVRGTTGGAWSGWRTIGGRVVDAPGLAAQVSGAVDVLARGVDLALWTRGFRAGSWGLWLRAWAVSATADPVPVDLAGVDWTTIATTNKVVALTFDAGANAAALPSILATLERKQVAATFFLTGNWARAHPTWATRIVAGGHIVGNHTMTHPYLTQLTDAQVRAEISQAETTIIRTNGADPRPLFRFPFGDRSSREITLANGLGYIPVRWTVDTLGWQGSDAGITTSTILQRVTNGLQPGEIVLMHLGSANDGSTLDADALPSMIDELRARGYGFVTMGALTG